MKEAIEKCHKASKYQRFEIQEKIKMNEFFRVYSDPENKDIYENELIFADFALDGYQKFSKLMNQLVEFKQQLFKTMDETFEFCENNTKDFNFDILEKVTNCIKKFRTDEYISPYSLWDLPKD